MGMEKFSVAVIGAGVMGEAIIKTLFKCGFRGNEIFVFERRDERFLELQEKFNICEGELENCQIVFLTIKPQDFYSVMSELKSSLSGNSLIISLMAGVNINTIEKLFSNKSRIVRIMTNTPILAGEGMSVIALSDSATKEDSDWVCNLFSKQGKVLLLDERQLDLVTAISGSGPAYFFAFAEVVTNVAVKLGLSSKDAKILVQQTFYGSANLQRERDKDFSELRSEVSSRGGTTEAALLVFESMQLEELVEKAIRAAMARSIQLSSFTLEKD